MLPDSKTSLAIGNFHGGRQAHDALGRKRGKEYEQPSYCRGKSKTMGTGYQSKTET